MYTISEWLRGSTREIEEKFIHPSLFTVALTQICEELVTLRIDAQCKNVVQTSFCFFDHFLFYGAVQKHLSFWCLKNWVLIFLFLIKLILTSNENVTFLVFIFLFVEILCCSNPVFPVLSAPHFPHLPNTSIESESLICIQM